MGESCTGRLIPPGEHWRIVSGQYRFSCILPSISHVRNIVKTESLGSLYLGGIGATMHETRFFGAGRAAVARHSLKAAARARLILLVAAVDGSVVFAAIAMSALLRSTDFLDDQTTNLLVVVLPIYLLLAFNGGAYNTKVLESWKFGARRAVSAMLMTAIVVIGLAFALKISTFYSRLAVTIGFTISAMALALCRYCVSKIVARLARGGLYHEIVLVDDVTPPENATHIIDAAALNLTPTLDSPYMLDRIGKMLWGADRVVVLCPSGRRRAWTHVLKGLGISGEVLLPEAEQLGLLGISRHNGRVTALVARGPLGARDEIVKRISDIAMVLAILPALMVVTLMVTIAIKLEDGGPVFFTQPRIGRGNRLFTMYKFRSMTVTHCDAAGTVSTQRDDLRVTRVGRFLRKTSIDELPQCFNVLRGDMSVVGPRPHAIGSTAENQLFWDIDERYWLRHAAKPGLTGLAQVRGYRGATATTGDVTKRLQADLEYLSGWSLMRDLGIILSTLRVVLHPNAF